jgi:Phage gp6-like head-tail connector protein
VRYRSLVRYELGSEPVTLAEAKLHLRIDSSDDDNLISALITTARKWAEDYCDRTFVVSKYTMMLDSFYGAIGSPVQFGLKADGNNIEGRQGTVPQLDIELPRPPASPFYSDPDAGLVSAPVVIKYKPIAGSSLTTLSSSLYRADYDSTPAVARPLYGGTWPSHLVDQNAVEVTWWAGPTTYWTDNTATTRAGTQNTAAVAAAIKLLVGQLWSNRDASAEMALTEIPYGVKPLLDTLWWGSYK